MVPTASCGHRPHSPPVFVLFLLSNYNNERPDTMFGPLALTGCPTRRLRDFHGKHALAPLSQTVTGRYSMHGLAVLQAVRLAALEAVLLAVLQTVLQAVRLAALEAVLLAVLEAVLQAVLQAVLLAVLQTILQAVRLAALEAVLLAVLQTVLQ